MPPAKVVQWNWKRPRPSVKTQIDRRFEVLLALMKVNRAERRCRKLVEVRFRKLDGERSSRAVWGLSSLS